MGPGAQESRSKQQYFDAGELDRTFGEDRKEAYWDDTNGHGALHPQPDGSYLHENFRGERKVATDEVLADLTAGIGAEDVV